MDSERDSNASKPSHPRRKEDNPFIAFRQYADELMSSLIHTVMGPPSSSTYQRTLRQHREAWDAASGENDNSEPEQRESRWPSPPSKWPESGRRSGDVGSGVDDEEKGSKTYNMPVRRWKGGQDNDSRDEVQPTCPYRLYGSSATVSGEPEIREIFWPRGFIHFWAFSPYSPRCLTQQEETRNCGPDWMEAFQDLLNQQKGSNDPTTTAEQPVRSPLDSWPGSEEEESNIPELSSVLRRLTTAAQKISTSPCRELANRQPENDNEDDYGGYDEEPNQEDEQLGILELPKGLRRMNVAARRFKELALRELENGPEADSMTELDFYERLFNQKQSGVESRSSKNENATQSNNTQSAQKGQLGIISTLTTTERVTLPDGTIHTKMMLKKRFADGREESSESVHTTHGGSQSRNEIQPLSSKSPSMLESTKPRTTQHNHDEEVPRKKGWFWS